MSNYGYPDLGRKYGWRFGVHSSPPGYHHPWLAVTACGTFGAWTREEARWMCRDRGKSALENFGVPMESQVREEIDR